MKLSPIMRLLIHIPVGLLNVAFILVSVPAAIIFAVGFLAYEITQGGEPHRDIKGWLWGVGIAGAIYFILEVAGIL